MKSNIVDFSLADQYHDGQRRRSQQPPSDRADLPLIKIEPGELYRIVNEAEQALLKSPGIYRFGGALVNVSWEDIRVAGGGTERVLRHPAVTAANLLDHLSQCARFVKFSKTAKDYITCDCPTQVAEAYIERTERRMPTLLGVTTAPTMKPDGTILDTPGYDQQSGLIYNPLGVDFHPIPNNPTKEDAAKALRYLANPLKYYSFVEPADRAAALSGILTALVRPAVPTAPMHAIDAPSAGSGKSLLVNVASIIATGHSAAVTSTGGSMNEFTKKLSASVLGGDTIISVDNISEELTNDLLCQLLTEPMVSIRIFGKLENVIVPATSAFFATGNNIAVAGDLTRRVFVIRIDTGKERPELEKYPFEPTKFARRFRPRLVCAALTLMRAYLISGERSPVGPLGSYEEWSRLVREPLVWLGEADPFIVVERTRKSDPRLQHFIDIITSWAGIIGVNHLPIYTRDVIGKTEERDADNAEQYVYPYFRDALRAVAPGTGNENISPDKLGWWFRNNKDRTIMIDYNGGKIAVRIMQDTTGTAPAARWILASANQISEIKKPDLNNPVEDPNAAPF